jgi:hypothetical protein
VPSDSVFAFRTQRRALNAADWESAPELLVHVNSAALSHLSWTTEDGAETALAFAPGMGSFLGHRRAADGVPVEIRGSLDGARAHPTSVFTTEDGGSLRLVVDDGSGVPVRSVTWHDQESSASIALRSASPSGNADVTDLVTAVRANYENVAGGEAAANLVLPTPAKWLAFHNYTVLEFDFSQPITLTSYALMSADDEPSRDPKAWVLRGSLDGRLWRNLDFQGDQPSFEYRHQSKTFRIGTPGPFKHIRIDLADTNGAPYLQLAGVRFLAGGGGFIGYRGSVAYRGVLNAPEPQSPPMLSWSEMPQLMRTSFGDPVAWDSLLEDVRESSAEFSDEPYDFMEVLQDPAYQDLTKEQILALVPSDYPHSFLVVADKATLTSPDHPLLVIDLYDEPGRDFRSVPDGIYSISANLDLANMDYSEFADSVDDDGVFRGF